MLESTATRSLPVGEGWGEGISRMAATFPNTLTAHTSLLVGRILVSDISPQGENPRPITPLPLHAVLRIGCQIRASKRRLGLDPIKSAKSSALCWVFNSIYLSYTQFSKRKPSTRSNSRRLLLNKTSPSLRAWAAMCRSFSPISRPVFSSSARILPKWAAALMP